MGSLTRRVRAGLPAPLISLYHFFLAALGAFVYGFPSRDLIVIGVTGTKGKSSTVEFLNAIFEAAGHKTALASTIRFKLAQASEPNLMRMTMAGRLFIQKFLGEASHARCTVAFVEMTSEGSRQFRHRFIDMDALIFTNLAPEHIESHGSLEAYAEAKLELGRQVARSHKRPRYIVANAEDSVSQGFLSLPVEYSLPFSLHASSPQSSETGGTFQFDGTEMTIHIPGDFSIANALAAATLARAMGIRIDTIQRGLDNLKAIPGRTQTIDAGQDFLVVVDYAHTPDSLAALYRAYSRPRICVLGATGGGRDTWKRPAMGAIADDHCEHIILTNEDPYDEDPASIIASVATGIQKKTPRIVVDRRQAIREAIALAKKGDVVLISGKGTDPCICGPKGEKTPWSDAIVAREELEAYMKQRTVQ